MDFLTLSIPVWFESMTVRQFAAGATAVRQPRGDRRASGPHLTRANIAKI